MGLQYVIQAKSAEEVQRSLSSAAEECEIFPIGPGQFGLSIPTRVVDSVREANLTSALRKLKTFDLYGGAWLA